MFLLVRINSPFFKQRYEQFTEFRASKGIVSLKLEELNLVEPLKKIQPKEIKLFLDPRYHESARFEKIYFDDISNAPKENCIIDPWEWTIYDFEKHQFKNPLILEFEEYENIAPKEFELEYYQQKEENILLSTFEWLNGPNKNIFSIQSGRIQKNNMYNLFMDPKITPLYFSKYFQQEKKHIDEYEIRKSVINEKDQQKLREFQKQEAKTWIKFWEKISKNFRQYTEKEAMEYFESLDNSERAFETILANCENSSLIHSTPKNKKLEEGILLVDAGARNLQGLSDITRTLWLGEAEPSSEIKKSYTKVLKAHIAVARAIFEKGTKAGEIDAIARKYTEFAHATGHGIGQNEVHAYPIISRDSFDILEANMLVTNEPGEYIKEKYGIRLESEMLIRETEDNKLYFEYLTLIPFEYILIETKQLSDEEKEWLSNFHKICYEELRGMENKEFLEKKVEPFLSDFK